MATKPAAQISATLRLRFCTGVAGGRLEGTFCDIGAKPHESDHEDQCDEQQEAKGQRDVAAAPGLGVDGGFPAGIAHRNSSRGARPIRCSASRVANSRVRYRIEKANRLRASLAPA